MTILKQQQKCSKIFENSQTFTSTITSMCVFLKLLWKLLILSQPAITCSKLTIEALEQRCKICSKLTIKTHINFEHISHLCSSVSIVIFEQVNAGWAMKLTHADIIYKTWLMILSKYIVVTDFW